MSVIGNKATVSYAVVRPNDVDIAADYLEEAGFVDVAIWMRELPEDKKIKWVKCSISDVNTANKIHITPDGEPIKCSCGCREFKESIIDITANVVCEKESNCTSCGRQVGYWGYGNWMIEPDDDRLVVTE